MQQSNLIMHFSFLVTTESASADEPPLDDGLLPSITQTHTTAILRHATPCREKEE